jgi:RND family efflux transporter MFP subunit
MSNNRDIHVHDNHVTHHVADHVVVRENRPNRAPWVLGAILLAVLGAGAFWYINASRPVPTKVVQRDIVGAVPLEGAQIVVPPSARGDVLAPFTGNVEKVNTSVGKHVSKGDVLVQLDLPQAEAVHEQTKATLQAAETAYANARAQYEQAIAAAQRNVNTARGSASGPTTTTSPDGTVVTVTPTVDPASAASAQQTLASLIAQRDAAVEPYRQQLEAAREANRQARAGEKFGYVRAPITGTVLGLNAQPGQGVTPDPKKPVVTVVDLSQLQVQAAVSNERAAELKEGTPVTLKFAEIPNRAFEGKVSRVTTQQTEKLGGLVKDSRYVAIIDFKNVDAVVRPGMSAWAGIRTGKVQNALAVPVEAVDTDKEGKPTVKVLRGGKWQATVVETGLSDGTYVQVKSGLKKDETIQVTPNVLNAAPLKR